MKLRTPMLLGLAIALASSSFADYTSRLWFKNETTGQETAGRIVVHPGDVVSLNFSFHATPNTSGITTWSWLQVALDLKDSPMVDDNSVNTDSENGGWDYCWWWAFHSSGSYQNVVYWEPDDGSMYDNASNPGATTFPLLTPRGIYGLIASKSSTVAHNCDKVPLFSFTVSQNAYCGEVLQWKRPGDPMASRVATQIIDGGGNCVDITDNYLQVAEPNDEASLWFSNDTTSQSNWGKVVVHPGDSVSVHFTYHQGSDPNHQPWMIVQATLDLHASTMMSSADQDAWPDAWLDVFPTQGIDPVGYVGPLHDNGLDPSDTSYDLVGPDASGVYGLACCIGSNPLSSDIGQLIFQFTVPTTAVPGEELHWLRPTNTDGGAVATRIIDGNANLVNIADNYLYVAPRSVTGQLVFGDWTPATPPVSKATFYVTSGGQTTTYDAPIATNGAFTVPAPVSGEFTLSVKVGTWLRKRLSADTSSGNDSLGTITLTNGDADEDNHVNLLDLSVVLANFGGAGPAGDLNGSQSVNLTDLSIALTHLGLNGDPVS